MCCACMYLYIYVYDGVGVCKKRGRDYMYIVRFKLVKSGIKCKKNKLKIFNT